MNRRTFVKQSTVTLAGSALGGALGLSTTRLIAGGNYPGHPPIKYFRTDLPEFEIPAYRGARYEDSIPDTLDIAARAELGVRVLTNIADPKLDYEVYWIAEWDRNPAIMAHKFSDWVQSVEGLMEALPLMRIASGSSLGDHVDPEWMRTNLRCLGPDGLVYVPLRGVPSSRLGGWWITPLWRADGTTTNNQDPSVDFVTAPAEAARLISTLTVYYLRDQNPLWRRTVEGMIERLSALMVDRGHFGYIPEGGLEPNARFGAGAAMPKGVVAVEGGNIRLIQGLAQYYRVTGYEPARKMAAKLTQFALGPAEYYDAQGRYLFTDREREFIKGQYPGIERGKFGGHFHAHCIGVFGILEYATTMNDRSALEFARSSYEWARAEGSPTVGFFPEMVLDHHYTGCEGCDVGDMVAMAIKLSLAGAGDYWDDADRWVRNQFAEQQLTSGDWIPKFAETQKATPVEYNETDQRVVESSLGGYLGRATANEPGLILTHCCTGNCLRTIYYVWENSVHESRGEFRVNLLLNRAAEAADVYSYIPYEGRVELKIKKGIHAVVVRAPEWIESGDSQLVARVNGKPRHIHWEGRYVDLGHAAAGDRLEVTFPISERTVKETIGAVPYTLIIKGSTVVSIDPPGKYGTFYQRAAYRSDRAPMRNVQRFVPEQTISW